MNITDTCFCLMSFFLIQNALCLVELELSVLQFDNPLGTSYTGQRVGKARKCCDTGGTNCRSIQDKCDVFFTFCIGSVSNNPANAGCNGTSIDMQKDVSRDVLKIVGSRNLTRFVNVDTWTKGVTGLIVNVLDIDELPSNDSVPHVFPDLIDAFNKVLDFDPAPNYWSAKDKIVSMVGHVSLDLRLRVWCARGWYGKSCENNCRADYFHSCSSDGKVLPHRECTDPDTSVLSVKQMVSTLQNTFDLQRSIVDILADDVCLKTTYDITVTIHEIREYRDGHIDIVFNGYCDNRPVSSLKFREVVYVMNSVRTRLTPLDDYFGFPVIPPTFRYITNDNVHIIALVRIINYQNLLSRNCSIGISPCNPTFKVHFSTSDAYAAFHALRTSSLTDCDGYFTDLGKLQTPSNTFNSTMLFVLETVQTYTTLVVEVGDLVIKSFNVTHQFPMSDVVVGTNFYNTYPKRFQKSTIQNTELTLETMAWCSNCQQGDRCQTAVGGGCDRSVTTTPPDCTTDSECKNGGRCAEQKSCLCKPGWIGPICNTDIDECALGVCVHADSCTNTRGGYMCTCSKGFTGINCEIDIDECVSPNCTAGMTCLNSYGSYKCVGVCTNNKVNENCTGNVDFCNSQPCLNNGTCTSLAFNFSCGCNTGWIGSTCEVNVNECTNTTVCHNGGVCTDIPGSFYCVCPGNFTGTSCDIDVDECLDPSWCRNNGTCINTYGGYFCKCTNGFTGETCTGDVDECKDFNICLNGLCSNTMGGYTCSCLSGWDGDLCDIDIDECLDPASCKNNATCLNKNGSFICRCPNGFTGSKCESDINECASNPCLNGDCRNSLGGYSCSCYPGWDGVNCDIDRDECITFDPCGNGGVCVNNPGSYSCNCTAHWTGSHCETDVNECMEKYACNLNGNCTNTFGNFSCSCFQGWTGHTCNEDIDECLLASSGCLNNGVCNNTDGGYICNCPSNWSGKYCDMDANECNVYAPCQHGGTCSNNQGSYKCSCPRNWTGVNCTDDYDECLLTNPCLNGGFCNNTDGSYVCNCPPQWTGSKCENDLNECLRLQCANNGTCSNGLNGYSCACTAAWTGQNCNVNVDECSKYSDLCKHGVCKDSVGSFSCDCIPGYQGQNCSEDVNECSDADLCKNSGTCENIVGSYICHCPKTWTGQNCTVDFNECQSQTPSPCHNGGTCVNTNGGFRCQCNTGWTGNVCEQDINECATFPCKNGGSCRNTGGKFSCSCVEGWNGNTCETNINDCEKVNCKNGGKCQDLVNDYKCLCTNGYAGKVCEVDIDDCASNPCQNGGNCHDHVGYFECVCPPGWEGTLCNTDIDECRNHPCARGEACRNNLGSYTCTAEHFITVTSTTSSTTSQGIVLENAIQPGCTVNGWNITIDMTILKQLYPTITTSHIYFGDNSCRGKHVGETLLFQQGFRDCLTSERVSSDTLIYENQLFYAIYDPINPYIIRQHKWTFRVECDVRRSQATSTHIHHDLDSHQAAVSGSYDMKMTFFTDANFMNEIAGNPIHVSIGDKIFIKVFTSAADWTVKMRLHTCYTKPSDDADDKMTYFLIKDGCEVDSNTHIISQSTHETRLVFQDFEYSTNTEGLNIYCNATFCETQDYSPGCAQSCVTHGTQALVG